MISKHAFWQVHQVTAFTWELQQNFVLQKMIGNFIPLSLVGFFFLVCFVKLAL